jgi:hypothetical protein
VGRDAWLDPQWSGQKLLVEKRGGDCQAPMLIDSVQVMESPKPVVFVPIGLLVPVVRLFLLNESLAWSGTPLR